MRSQKGSYSYPLTQYGTGDQPKRCRLEVAAAMEYEETLADFERAMREGRSKEVQTLIPQITTLSEQLRHQPGLAAHLEKGRFGSTARAKLRKEYISRYVMLRGGGPTYADGDPGANTPLLGTDEGCLSELTEPSIRHGFIQKVYGILFAQLTLTVVIAATLMPLIHGANAAVVSAGLILSLVAVIALMCVCMCNPSLMKSYPSNYVILFVFTIAESVLVAFVGSRYTAESVLIVAGITALVVFGLSLFACQTSYDFSGAGPYLLCALLVMCGLSFCFMFGAMMGLANTPAFQGLRLIFAACGALLFSFYIVYDTQLIIGGKHQTQFSVDDYCMAALILYMDIIQLFFYLLELLGGRK